MPADSEVLLWSWTGTGRRCPRPRRQDRLFTLPSRAVHPSDVLISLAAVRTSDLTVAGANGPKRLAVKSVTLIAATT
jgi:hypothetical protein